MKSIPLQALPVMLLCASLLSACGNSDPSALTAAADAAGDALTLKVLSNRADLVSGGDALVEVLLPEGADAKTLRMELDGQDISSAFALRENGRYMGLVTGMADSKTSRLAARLPNGSGSVIDISNHPNGGPIFAGEQIQPWPCFAEAVDGQCNFPARYQYWYKVAGTPTPCAQAEVPPGCGPFQRYDPQNPAGDVAMTTTDDGRTVPYIVREEIGAQDRGEYRIAVLFDPTQPWAPWQPQPGWNGKTYITGGSGCGMHHGQTTSPSVIDDNALSRGYAVISTSLDHNTLNCNLVVQAEALMMLKERVVEAYGPIRYTIGSGCSGGSIYQQQVANAYPGIFDGILPACSFPDTWTTMIEVQECKLILNYFNKPQTWAAGVLWPQSQQAVVSGHETVSVCQAWETVYGFTETMNPYKSAHPINTQDCNVSAEEAYHPVTNPRGVRCSLQDYMVSIFGRRPDGFANRPWDNVGVQYGFKALMAGQITKAQFIDLNKGIGGFDIDHGFQAQRSEADLPALTALYRGGMANAGNAMDELPMIDLRSHNTVEIHHDYRSYVMRARLDRENGHHDNQVIWTTLLPVGAPGAGTPFAFDPLTVMDSWLSAIQADGSTLPIEQKVVRNKPTEARDQCSDSYGHEIPDQTVCQTTMPYYASPRIAAGSGFTEDAMKCQLKPLFPHEYYPIQFTEAEFAVLRAIFPTGVCDWSHPGVEQQPTIPWQTYSAGPGGMPLQPPPVSRALP